MKIIEYEPKRKNRFIVLFPDSFEIEPWTVTHLVRPAYDMKLKKWDEITIEFIDCIAVPTAKGLYNLIKHEVDTVSFTVEMLDPTGVVVEKWGIFGNIKKINFDELNYASDDIIKPTMTVQPTSCVLI